jgi:hypothetical protein
VWFAVWEGYGFGTGASMIVWHDPPPDEATRRAREAERRQLRHDDLRRNAEIRSALGEPTKLELPHREYYLLGGPLTGVTELRDPNEIPGAGGWQRPDLFWPDDRRWFVATDVDFWSLYIGGDAAFIDDLSTSVPSRCETVASTDVLVVED